MMTLLLACVLSSLPAEFLDAVKKGDGTAIRTLMEKDPALVNARGEDGVPAVRLALYYRHPEIARTLIDKGAVLDLYDASAAGRIERLRELVAADASRVNTVSTDGAMPLALAAFFADRETVLFLLDHGARTNMLQTNPAFPFAALHSAMSAGHRDIVDLLLARGADVNVREGGGMTVLHEAAALGSMEYVKLLLAHGANPRARTDEGKLPEDFARERNKDAVAEFLKANGRPGL